VSRTENAQPMPGCLIFEDEHLLVVNKPPGLNTHSPSPYAGEGIYEWLRHREPRWKDLAIIHRLDKETSGVLVFSKTTLANRSLTEQFTSRKVRKQYLLLTDRSALKSKLRIRTALQRVGSKYLSRPVHAGGDVAETLFEPAAVTEPAAHPRDFERGQCHAIMATPLTGRTHQIRVHASDQGFPILGDSMYGGTAASRLFLHALSISLKHPVSGAEISFTTPARFEAPPRSQLRSAMIEQEFTDAFRVVHGASDGWPGWYVDQLNGFYLSQSSVGLDANQRHELQRLLAENPGHGVYHKRLTRQVRGAAFEQVSATLELGKAADKSFLVRENGLKFNLTFEEGYSTGLFLDQRDNRRRLLTGHVAADFDLWPAKAKDGERSPAPRPTILNVFAYTCGFAVAAAKGGAHSTSLDLSRKYLDWGRQNFELNGLSPSDHDFIYGDAFEWLRRLARKQRLFDVIILDPPTFSQSKASGVFRAEKDYGKLVTASLPLLKPQGVLLASSNASGFAPEEFVTQIRRTAQPSRRTIVQEHYFPQPIDFPVSPREPAYLKTIWLRFAV